MITKFPDTRSLSFLYVQKKGKIFLTPKCQEKLATDDKLCIEVNSIIEVQNKIINKFDYLKYILNFNEIISKFSNSEHNYTLIYSFIFFPSIFHVFYGGTE